MIVDGLRLLLVTLEQSHPSSDPGDQDRGNTSESSITGVVPETQQVLTIRDFSRVDCSAFDSTRT